MNAALWSDGEARALRWLTLAGLLLAAVGWVRQDRAVPAAVAAEQPVLDARLDAVRRIDLNTADALALESLPGVGRVTAEAIIEYRRAHGGLARVDELQQILGVKPGLIDRVRPFVRVVLQEEQK